MDPNLKQDVNGKVKGCTKEEYFSKMEKYMREAVRNYGFCETISAIQGSISNIIAENFEKLQEVPFNLLQNMKDRSLEPVKMYMLHRRQDRMMVELLEDVANPVNSSVSLKSLQMSSSDTEQNTLPTAAISTQDLLSTVASVHEKHDAPKWLPLRPLQEMSEEVKRKRKFMETSQPLNAKRWKRQNVNISAEQSTCNEETSNHDPLSVTIYGLGNNEAEQVSYVGSLQNSASSDDDSICPYSPYPHVKTTDMKETSTIPPPELGSTQESTDSLRNTSNEDLGRPDTSDLHEEVKETKDTNQESAYKTDPGAEVDIAPQEIALPLQKDESASAETSTSLTDEQKLQIERLLAMNTPYKSRVGITTKDQMIDHTVSKRSHYNRIRTTPHWKLELVVVTEALDLHSYYEKRPPNNNGEGEIHYPYSGETFTYLKDESINPAQRQYENFKHMQPGQIVWFYFNHCRYPGYVHNIYYDDGGMMKICCKEFIGSKGAPTSAWVKYKHVTPFDYDFYAKMCYWKKHNHAESYYENVAEAILHRGTTGYYEEFMPKPLFKVILSNEKYHKILAHAPERLLTAWFKYENHPMSAYCMTSLYYTNWENVFLDALDKVPKYDNKGGRRCPFLELYCNVILLAQYLKHGKDYPYGHEPGQNPSGLLAASHRAVFPNNEHKNFTLGESNDVMRRAQRLVEDHTSCLMKYRLHLIDEPEYNRLSIANPPVSCQPKKAPKRAKRSSY